jgi:hypothetical protein
MGLLQIASLVVVAASLWLFFSARNSPVKKWSRTKHFAAVVQQKFVANPERAANVWRTGREPRCFRLEGGRFQNIGDVFCCDP